jgi:hypothetical protein
MRAWVSCTGAELLTRDAADIVGSLAKVQAEQSLSASAEQIGAWEASLTRLREMVAANGGGGWTIALEYDLVRLGKRIDAVVLTDRAILVLEFKTRDASPAALAEAEDYALDLRDFHAGSRDHPIVPILVTEAASPPLPAQPPLLWHGVIPPVSAGGATLAALAGWVQAHCPIPKRPLDGAAWLTAPYRPVPGIVEAATMLYARNGVADIAAARADAANLTRTTAAIARAVATAKAEGARLVVFVTGIPGAGKTLCGLNAVFGPARQEGAAFLTGNAPLVTVLRAALAEDAVSRRDASGAEAKRRVGQAIQNVHRFLEHYVLAPDEVPHERLIVFDEAQRAWDEAKARQGSQNRTSRLTMSEPAHTLEIMGRHQGWSVIVALIGNGQEINTGEAGLAEWHRVIEASGTWRSVAADTLVPGTNPSWLVREAELHLGVSMRSVRDAAAASWVEAVVDGDRDRARRIADEAGGVPFHIVRDPAALRTSLRRLARGRRRAGLVRAAGAKRARAEGFGAEVQGDDIAHWFLRRWPDVRGSDALEVCATEYACQGLELDVVGLVWGGDFIRGAGGWQARRFAGTRWQREVAEFDFVRNTYRVLMTRARYETVIYIPRGDAADATRDPATFDAIAGFLTACGAETKTAEASLPPPSPQAVLV